MSEIMISDTYYDHYEMINVFANVDYLTYPRKGHLLV